jgi:hypothetical protein
LKDYLSLHVADPSRLEVVGKEDRVTTGNFEVTFVVTSQVLHRKRHASQGRTKSAAAKKLILDQINDLLHE